MNNCFIVFSSVNQANKVKSHLPRDGKMIFVVSTPHSISKGGCSYSIKCKKNNLNTVKKAAKEAAVRIKSIYEEIKENGEIIYKEI